MNESTNAASALARVRWSRATEADRLAQGKMLAEARAKARRRRQRAAGSSQARAKGSKRSKS